MIIANSKSLTLALSIAGIAFFSSCEKEDFQPQIESCVTSNHDLSFPGKERADAVSFVIDNIAYVGTGFNTSGSIKDHGRMNDFYSCTTQGDLLVWNSSKWDLTGKGVSSMPEIDPLTGEKLLGRNGAVAFVINGKGYVGLGNDGYQLLKDFWEFDPKGTPDPDQYPSIYSQLSDEDKATFGTNSDGSPTGKWTRLTDYPGDACVDAYAFSLKCSDGNKYGFVSGGEDWKGSIDKNLYKFNPNSNTWSATEYFYSKCKATSFILEENNTEYAYVFGGSNIDTDSRFARFNPIDNIWETLNRTKDATRLSFDDSYGSLNGYSYCSFVLNNKAYVTMGFNHDNTYSRYIWEYDSENDLWSTKEQYCFAITNAVSFVLEHETPNGKEPRAYLTTGSDNKCQVFYNSTYSIRPQ